MMQEAGQPEIFRASQRDETFQKYLNDITSEIIQGFFGLPTWIRWREHIRLASKLAYLSLTTVSNLQTLGEEYTGIVHWTAKDSLPSKQVQIVMVLLDCFGENILLSAISRFEKYLTSLSSDHPLRPEARTGLLRACDVFRRSLPFLQRLHKSVFYLQGRYYQVSKRVTGVRYALVRFWLRDRSVLPTFRLLGALSLLQQLGTAALSLRASERNYQPSELPMEDCVKSAERCSLCLNKLKNSSVTPCGHIYCWYCIVPWVIEQPFCPLCRQDAQPSRIVLLRNYSC